MSLQVFNYLTREKETFKSLERDCVGMYVCGPTVYDHAHLGHAKLYVAMDVIVRYLRYLSYKVRYVQNITDVGHLLDSGEDRIMKGARRERVEPMEVVETYTRSYFEDMDALGVVRPNISPRASAHIPEQIEMVKSLLEKGYAYETPEGDVYFSVEKFPEYGKLSGRKVDELEPGARVVVREEKRHPADFALWKHAEPEHILRWPSPWGWGYPGWHAECTAMATKYLGETIDIHGGGLENIFPHNECELAQSEAVNGKQFARYWILAGSLTVNGVKMSKSLGNFLTIKEALKLYTPEAIRFFILSSHYRGPMDYSRDAMMAAQRGVERLHNTVRALRARAQHSVPSGTADLSYIADIDPHRDAFIEAMNDDFNTPRAIAALFDFNKEVNALLASEQPASRGTLAVIDRLYRELGGRVLGIIPDDLTQDIGGELVEGLMDVILGIRQQYRAASDWDQADLLRRQLAGLGVVVDDRPDGTAWRLERAG
ncbi:MAG: cysteine--tRNA ligase [Chloroflexi bacterium]|nr:MAG: cysteine--tRNA ligase [Anaerolineaceae bacterium 4572_32.2]RLC78146.1 MAG: cysteine--tRNA ligase [Chloroflexota bacterium]RLC85182.1 MAG: cysteine--tRNA ligase [Chloroflexota bacterium]HEY73288.1 cysteine--tRNA ligase [Thermoflexia bacterium]